MKLTFSPNQIRLFRSLFTTRDDVFARYWADMMNEKSGFAPIYNLNQQSHALTDNVIREHLLGRQTIGVYPLFPDNTTAFLVIDFDGKNWFVLAHSLIEQAKSINITAYLERSRSGDGGHVWLFFEQPVAAYKARQLGKLLLSQTGITTRKTFDRMFPSQDEHTGKGFGNLICLPFQGNSVVKGNTVFINFEGIAYPDQWHFLSLIKKVTSSDIDRCVTQKTSAFHQLNSGETPLPTEFQTENRLDAGKDKVQVENVSEVENEPTVATTQGQEVHLTLSACISIPNLWLPDKVFRFLKKKLNFPNPEFYAKERFGYSTWQTTRFIKTLEVFPDHISVPIGFLTQLLAFTNKEQLIVKIQDNRVTTKVVRFSSTLKLRADQQKILKSLMLDDRSILEAHPGFGKTMVALALMKKRQQKTIIIVHTTILLDQWLKRLNTYFKLNKGDLGIIGNNKWQIGKKVTIASYMTLTRRGIDDVRNQFGLVIIDECHHVPANTFSDVVKQFPAKYSLGLTATAYRKDKLERLMRLYVSDSSILVPEQISHDQTDDQTSSVQTQLITRQTAFRVARKTEEFQELGKYIIADVSRNDQIATDIVNALNAGDKCIVLTERIEHCETLLASVRGKAKNIHAAIATGNMTKKNREGIAKRMMQERFQLLIATGKLIGEGFDWPAVSHIFFAFPFSWKGRLIQYVGRVQRPYEGKTVAVVHDYFDDQVPMLKLMYFKRLRTYRTMGLQKIESPVRIKETCGNQPSLF